MLVLTTNVKSPTHEAVIDKGSMMITAAERYSKVLMSAEMKTCFPQVQLVLTSISTHRAP